MSQLEYRRQAVHVLFGLALVGLHYCGILTNDLLLGVVLGGGVMSLLIKNKKTPRIQRFLSFFERDHHLKAFPGRGPLFFALGSYVSLIFFEPMIAYAGIMILTMGDAISNIVGRHFGKIRTKLNPEKCIEGNLVGILAALPLAYCFFPNLYAVTAAATVGMFLEIPRIQIFGFEIDDNLLIPIGAGFTLTLFT